MKTNSRPLQTVVFALIALGLIGLALGGYLTPVSRILLNPVISAQNWVTTRYQAAVRLISAPQDTVRLRQRNAELEAEVSRLQAQIIELEQQLSETKILSALVDFARANPENRYQAAAVVARDPSPFMQYVIINRGSDDGLRRGMPVVTAQGLVGRIAAVTAGAARVQLITDPASTVNVHLEPSGAQAVLFGSITAEITLEMIPQSAEVKPGDLVLTSGLGGGFPANILIGQLAGVRSRDQDLFQRATIQSVVDFTHLEIVLVITNFTPIDYSPLISTPQAP
ncbi:MAG: rod shape-determining protein MreC [Anaerolineales bacterium]|nr:rod shape-determining protein MreC [Anaerolineales bacterium]MDD5468402.1 rod shape-determining protein MreC [Anaerolineales bacterium]